MWQRGITQTQSVFDGEYDSNYAFYNVGRRQPATTSAQATTVISERRIHLPTIMRYP